MLGLRVISLCVTRMRGEWFGWTDYAMIPICMFCSKKIVAKLLKQHQEFLINNNISLKDGSLLSFISKVKAKGLTADDALKKVAEYSKTSEQERALRHMANKTKPDILEGKLGEIIASVYKEYEKSLRESNSLDFDDLLLFGVKLFAQHKKASSWCQHVLVDE